MLTNANTNVSVPQYLPLSQHITDIVLESN